MRAAPLVGILLVLAGCAAPAAEPDAGSAGAGRAVVVSSNPLAAAAGAWALERGGNAIDAAAAVAFALTVVEPHFSGIGGGGFLLYRRADGFATVLDGRETAPAAAAPDQFLLPGGAAEPPERAQASGRAVGVPGAVRLWERAILEHGALPFADALDPAARYAEDGFEVDAYLARYLADPVNRAKLASWPASARLFYPGAVCPPVAAAPCVGGEPHAEGDLLRQPDLARTLRLLQERGADAFYAGAVADAIVATVAAREGRMSADDLARYALVEREPLSLPYRGDVVLSTPPPAGGLIVLHMLGLLEPLDLRSSGHHEGATLHKVVEAMHLAYADRAAYLGDPAFVDVPVAGLLDPAYLAERRALIGERANPDVRAGDPPREREPEHERAPRDGDLRISGHTSHLLVVDHAGNVASATMTIESLFGTGLVVPDHGFLLNNELTDFDFQPGGANELQPGKRPRSAMSPTIVVRDSAPVAVVGASGGPTIIASVLQVLVNLLEHELDVERATLAGRVYSPRYGDAPFDVRWDRDVPQSARDDLAARGHHPWPVERGSISQVEAALLGPGGWTGAADTRAAAGGVVYVERSAG